jgi:hypothetical protein
MIHWEAIARWSAEHGAGAPVVMEHGAAPDALTVLLQAGVMSWAIREKPPSRTRVSNPVVLTPSDMLECEMQRTESSITTMPEPTRLETDAER